MDCELGRVTGYKLSRQAAQAYDRRAVWAGPQAEAKAIVSLNDGMAQWAGVSRQDGVNFRTNQVTLAEYQDRGGSGNALGLSATWACVNKIAGTVGSLPLIVYKPSAAGTAVPAGNHPLNYVLRSPNFEQGALEFWEIMVASIELHGNAYAAIERRGDGSVLSLSVVRPDLVTVRWGRDGRLEYEWSDGKRNVRSYADMLHIRGPMGNALGGLSTLRACPHLFSSAMAAEQAARAVFTNGMRPSGVFQTDEKITGPQRDDFMEGVASKYQGAMNFGKPFVLDGGMKWQQINITPEDAQMLESRRFSGEEICRAFEVPPAMVGYGDKSSNWGTGKEVDVLGFYKDTIRRRLKRIEQALMKQLLTPADKAAGITIEFNIEALLRGDSQGRAAFYQSGLQNGWLTINEVRAHENLPPVPGGDVPRMQMQNVPITQAGQEEVDA